MVTYMVLGCRFAFAPPVAPHLRLLLQDTGLLPATGEVCSSAAVL